MQCPKCKLDRPQWDFAIDRVTLERVFRMKKCAACAAAITRQWRENNRDRHHAAVRKWSEDNPELVRLYRQRTQQNCRERINAWKRRYRKLKPERYRLERQRYIALHPEVIRLQKIRNKRNCRAKLGRRYVVELLRDATARRGKPFNPTVENLQRQKLNTQIWRTKRLFRVLATAPHLSK